MNNDVKVPAVMSYKLCNQAELSKDRAYQDFNYVEFINKRRMNAVFKTEQSMWARMDPWYS